MKVPKLLAPFREVEQVEGMVAAGAEELFCGLMDDEWIKKYSTVFGPNRRDWDFANFRTAEELAKAVDAAHAHDVPVFVTFNTPVIHKGMYPDLMRLVRGAVEAGVDALIMADISLLMHIRNQGIDINVNMGTDCSALNEEAVKMYADLGVRRVVLERHLTPREVTDIAQRVDIGVESFVLFRRCGNMDGYCTFHHGTDVLGLGDVACRLPYTYTMSSQPGANVEAMRTNLSRMAENYARDPEDWGLLSFDLFECGLCAIYDFAHAGLGGVKVSGRAMPFWEVVLDGVRTTRMLLDTLANNPEMTRPEFYGKVQNLLEHELPEPYRRKCAVGNCFYPWVMEHGGES